VRIAAPNFNRAGASHPMSKIFREHFDKALIGAIYDARVEIRPTHRFLLSDE
jgi:hypothetical protein